MKIRRICIDAGHGGKDAGAVNKNYREKDAALQIALMLGEELLARGHEIMFTREEDEFVELEERCRISNLYECDIFVSIHLNSVANNPDAYGIETWCYRVPTKLAKAVQSELAKLTDKDRGVKTANYYVLKHTKAPAILVECGFISNEVECKKLFEPDYQHEIAVAIANGLG